MPPFLSHFFSFGLPSDTAYLFNLSFFQSHLYIHFAQLLLFFLLSTTTTPFQITMYAKTAVVSLLLASSALAAPLSQEAVQARELEARLSLPAGALGDLAKSLGKGLLSGGAITGLLSLLGEGSSDSSSTSRRDLEARAGLAGLLEKLVGAGGESLESVIKNAVLGGVASGAAVEGVNAVAGQSSKRSVAGTVVGDAAKVAEKGIGSVLGNGVADGLGSALGGLGISAVIGKLFGSSSDSSTASSKRALADLSDDEVNTLLEWIGTLPSNSVDKRAAISSSVGKGLAGVVAGLAATQGAEAAIEKLESLFRRELSFDELD
ncbi:hypothetical protein FB45DRAFT_1004571 [Roridomyces roridus]|uniref:Uncharacterized protein n=1 Tax=Roridomyces roridus TaxID=1738132 RepID=A0AAD7BPC1_9AGAR|nr:hypothetical protein FB45DRAFT_1004571 [Roridomyces roridus]